MPRSLKLLPAGLRVLGRKPLDSTGPAGAAAQTAHPQQPRQPSAPAETLPGLATRSQASKVLGWTDSEGPSPVQAQIEFLKPDPLLFMVCDRSRTRKRCEVGVSFPRRWKAAHLSPFCLITERTWVFQGRWGLSTLDPQSQTGVGHVATPGAAAPAPSKYGSRRGHDHVASFTAPPPHPHSPQDPAWDGFLGEKEQ